MKKKISLFLFIVILISGYVSLALELLAMRQIIPYLGNDTIITSIIIGVVLISLSFGYYMSGKINIKKDSIRQKILNNFIISTVFIFIGTSYIFLDYYFRIFEYVGIKNKIFQAFSFSMLLLSVPSYLLAQTTPLLSNYFSKNISGKTTGKMLALGTIGSFCGSILTTLLIMPFFGVNYAVMFNVFLITIAILLLNKRNRLEIYLVCFLFLIVTFFLNNTIIEKKLGILSNNSYSTIKVLSTDNGNSKTMLINNSISSKISKNKDLMFEYIKYIDENFISTLPKNAKKLNILVIGAGGFTIGVNDNFNNYIFVDIDKSLMEVSEKYFLNKKLEDNKKFVVQDGRAFLKTNTEKFDLVILDTYSHGTDIPSQLITFEYFNDVKNVLSENGIMVANIITFANFQDSFSVKIDNTLRFVFKNLQRQVIGNFNPYDKNTYSNYRNIIYAYYNGENKNKEVYSDNKSSSVFDINN